MATNRSGLEDEQPRLASLVQAPWRPQGAGLAIGAAIVCFPRGQSGPGSPGDPAWAGAVVLRDGQVVAEATATGTAGAAYVPGQLALREGPCLQAAVEALAVRPDVLLVDATGRDHPRRAGLALQLGAAADRPPARPNSEPSSSALARR